MDNAQYAELFLTESREHVSAINHSLLELERAGATESGESVGAIFRAVHTIKGMSATMGYTAVATLSHELETLLDNVRRGVRAVDAPLMELLFQSADILENAIEGAVQGRLDARDVGPIVARLRHEGLSVGRPSTMIAALTTADDEWSASAPESEGLLVRVRLVRGTPLKGVRAFLVVQAARKLGEVTGVSPSLEAMQADDFDHDFALRIVGDRMPADVEAALRTAGDVAEVRTGDDASLEEIPPQTMEFSVADLSAAKPAAAATDADPPVARQQRSVRIDLRRLDALMNMIGELVITRGRLVQLAAGSEDAALIDTVAQASRLIADLQDEIMTSRMVPVWQVFDRFPRLVRDAARSVGKEVTFSIEGKDVELDRSMLEEVGDPIVHLLRNAVDHGIEIPADRIAKGKPAAGRLTLSALRDRSAVAIRVSDDGRGIDRSKVLRRAQESGLMDAAKTELTDEELVRLIARAGFSTAERVTDLSGRGVGVDAVYNRVRSLGGSVDIRSVPNEGTTVTLRLPLTLAIVRSLLARVGDETYAMPMTHVSETVELRPAIMRSLQGREVMMIREEVLPLIRLRTAVSYEGPPPTGLEHVIVVEMAERRAGLVVDALIGQQEIVVKQFDGVRDARSLFGGATILGDGAPALIIDVSSLL